MGTSNAIADMLYEWGSLCGYDQAADQELITLQLDAILLYYFCDFLLFLFVILSSGHQFPNLCLPDF